MSRREGKGGIIFDDATTFADISINRLYANEPERLRRTIAGELLTADPLNNTKGRVNEAFLDHQSNQQQIKLDAIYQAATDWVDTTVTPPKAYYPWGLPEFYFNDKSIAPGVVPDYVYTLDYGQRWLLHQQHNNGLLYYLKSFEDGSANASNLAMGIRSANAGDLAAGKTLTPVPPAPTLLPGQFELGFRTIVGGFIVTNIFYEYHYYIVGTTGAEAIPYLEAEVKNKVIDDRFATYPIVPLRIKETWIDTTKDNVQPVTSVELSDPEYEGVSGLLNAGGINLEDLLPKIKDGIAEVKDNNGDKVAEDVFESSAILWGINIRAREPWNIHGLIDTFRQLNKMYLGSANLSEEIRWTQDLKGTAYYGVNSNFFDYRFRLESLEELVMDQSLCDAWVALLTNPWNNKKRWIDPATGLDAPNPTLANKHEVWNPETRTGMRWYAVSTVTGQNEAGDDIYKTDWYFEYIAIDYKSNTANPIYNFIKIKNPLCLFRIRETQTQYANWVPNNGRETESINDIWYQPVIVPLFKPVLENTYSKYRDKLAFDSCTVITNTYSVQELDFWETEQFAFLAEIAVYVYTAYTLGAGAPAGQGLLAVLGSMTAKQAVIHLAKLALREYIKRRVFKWIADKLAPEWAAIFMLAYEVYNFKSTGKNWGQLGNLQKLDMITAPLKYVGDYYDEEAKEINERSIRETKQYEDGLEKLKEKNEWIPKPIGLDYDDIMKTSRKRVPNILVGETPDMFYMRTTTVISLPELDSYNIEHYHEQNLQLPKMDENLSFGIKY